MQRLRSIAALFVAFLAGAFAARLPSPARADAPPTPAIRPTAIDLNALDPANFPPATSAFPNMRIEPLARVDETTFAYTAGTAPKHTHASTTEVQLVLAGTGTEWLGDRQVPIAPGTLLIIPPNTAHSGFTGGPFRMYVVKTPPQAPGDYHMVP